MKPISRQRLYDTGIAIFGVLVVWGVLSIDEAAQLTETFDKLMGLGLLLLARRNVPKGDDD